jgi:uncharacterized protein (TIGR02231 family)
LSAIIGIVFAQRVYIYPKSYRMLIRSIFLLIFLMPTFIQAQESVKSSVTDVTVFLQGAQVHRKANFSLKPGDNRIIFKDLSPQLDANSIQIKGNPDFMIFSVKHSINYLGDQTLSPDIQSKKDSLEDLQFKLQMRQALRGVFGEEKQMILTNRSIKGNDANLLADDLMEVADFYRNRLKEIEFRILELNQEEREINESIYRLQNELNDLNARFTKYTSEIEVLLRSEKTKSTTIEFSYLSMNAGWYPVYDIRANEIGVPVELAYRAKVYQSTGDDWKSVNLSLSTGNPSAGGTPPAIYPWYLYMNDPIVQAQGKSGYRKDRAYGDVPVAATEELYMWNDDMKANTLQDKVTVQSNLTNVEFKIGVPSDIPSDNQHYDVQIQQFDLPAEYRYFVAPSADKDAFLIARARDWREHNLLSGETNIYYQGTFVGKSYIDPSVTSDTLELSLGRDNAISVTRDQIKEFCKTSVLGSKKATTKAFKIKVTNGKKKEINILVRDQVPLSTNAEIEVNNEEVSGGKFDAETGFVDWDLKLAPGETKELILRYTVKYPKKKIIPNL